MQILSEPESVCRVARYPFPPLFDLKTLPAEVQLGAGNQDDSVGIKVLCQDPHDLQSMTIFYLDSTGKELVAVDGFRRVANHH